MNHPAIDLQGVSCTFISKDDPGQRYTAVRNVTLTVGAGEFVSVVGPTGCGKSTLLNVAAGLLTPSGTDNRPVVTHGPLDVEHVSAGTNYASDASVAKTSGVVATKQLLISAPLRNVSQQGGHDEASASRGWSIMCPASPPAGHRGTDSSCLGKRVTGGGGTP